MKYLFNSLNEIKIIMNQFNGFVLMFDFDGTLSPIAPTPNSAFLSAPLKIKLKELAKIFPVVIISGRRLNDIKKKVGIKNLIYAGNHGLEWQIKKKPELAPGAKKYFKLLLAIKPELKKIIKVYPDALLENKRLSLAIHYRKLTKKPAAELVKKIIKTVRCLNANNELLITNGKKVLELRPNINWNKGKFALFIFKYLQNKFKKKLLPLYAGDDATDEDAFALLAGITTRVGYNKLSRAKFYIKNNKQIIKLIHWLVQFNSPRKQ